MRVRRAEPSDAAACVAAYAPAIEQGFASFEETVPGADEMAERIASALMWVVADDGGVTGYACATPFHPRAGYRWVAAVAAYVHPDHQGRGIGRALYAELLDHLSNSGLRWAMAGIALPNAASVALHEAFGFERAGLFRDIGYKAGAWRSVGWWQLELATDLGDPPREPLPH